MSTDSLARSILDRIGTDNGPASDLIAVTATHVYQTICKLRGHNMMLHFAPGRLWLRCATCHYETSGWQLEKRPKS